MSGIDSMDQRWGRKPRGRVRQAIADHPALSFSVLAIGVTWIGDIAAILAFGSITPGLLLEFVVLIGAAFLVTGLADGRPGIRHLLAGVVRWRVGWGWYLAALLGLPLLTLLIALATGTFASPAGGWLPVIGAYAMQVLLLGVLLGNVWEEMGWTGIVQRRLMERHGLVAGGALTAIPFVLIHLPLAFSSGFAVPISSVLLIWGVLIMTAPIMRWLMGVTYLGTGGSILLVGIMHASFNGAGQLSVIPGDGTLQSIGALVILLGLAWLIRARQLRRASAGERARLLPQPQPEIAR